MLPEAGASLLIEKARERKYPGPTPTRSCLRSSGVTSVEKRVVLKQLFAGARQAFLIEEPMAVQQCRPSN